MKNPINTRPDLMTDLARLGADAIDAAAKYVELEPKESGRHALLSARICFSRGNFTSATTHALTAIAYSVGFLHPDYDRINESASRLGF